MSGAEVALLLGRVAGLSAAGLLMFQFVLSARLKWLDRALGIDRLLRGHAAIGATACALAILHPLLVYGSGLRKVGELRWDVWPEAAGAIALLLIGLVVATSLWGALLMLSYQAWRRIHQFTFLIVVAALVHGLALGSGLALTWARVVAIVLGSGYVGLFVWVKIVKPRRLARSSWTVSTVEAVGKSITQVGLTPPAGAAMDHRPGQFVFVRFRSETVRAEQHPFTISSAPGEEGVGLTIKASGDFTRAVGQLQIGEKAVVDGPYGRFSHELLAKPHERLVMIAGGVGVTPFMSMLGHMVGSNDARAVTLIWACRREEDLFWRDELESIRAKLGGLAVHYVLSQQEGWDGETGHISAEMLGRLLSDEDRKARAFVCGPEGMMDSTKRALRRVGVSRRRIHTERFGL